MAVTTVDVHAYCRDVEAYLCRKNGGHLVRVVGPAFDVVRAWADEHIPLSVAFAGIDRTVDRAIRSAAPRRRPLRVEFCDADVRDAFDAWRRAVGAIAASPDAPRADREPLRQHIQRAALQLTAASSSGRLPSSLSAVVRELATAVDALVGPSSGARGAARERVIARLADLDQRLVDEARAALSAAERAEVARDAESELAAFRDRLDAAQWQRALDAASGRLVRQRIGLPAVAFD